MRITASNFGTIAKATIRRDLKSLALGMLTPKDLRCPAILHGRKYERRAVKKYEEMMNVNTSECGLFVSHLFPMIGASPDRVVDENTILEIKCPFSSRNQKISPKTVPYLVENNGKLELKQNHDYYYQVQGQLFCSERNLCDFVVYTFEDIAVISIPRDEAFIDLMLGKLTAFFDEYFSEAVINKNFYHNYGAYTFEY